MSLEEYFEIVLEAGWETCEFYTDVDRINYVLLIMVDDECGLHPMGYDCERSCADAYEKLSPEDRTTLRESNGGVVISLHDGQIEYKFCETSDIAFRYLSDKQDEYKCLKIA